ncbi:hypothetical protein NDU88_004836 [Pleurodeles waltl]|uniref:Uncharacterized protein n=1 Tax=Pleurodeles waltl TaxID=8319 RepID=A0AAV7NUW1_PLEWA|nr:hypothetical protein NDU88_004836 [Pleurodeles waltl]
MPAARRHFRQTKDSQLLSMSKMVFCVKSDDRGVVGNVGAVDEGPIVMPECTVKIDDKVVKVLAESGSPYAMIGDKNWHIIFGGESGPLEKPDINPVSYGGTRIEVKGYRVMTIQFQDRMTVGKVYVAKRGDNLLGWQHKRDLGIKLDPNSTCQVMVVCDQSVNLDILKEFPTLFNDELGCG